jgi:hypothetical protein
MKKLKETAVWIRKYTFHLIFVWIVAILYLLTPTEKSTYYWGRAKVFAYAVPFGLALAYGELFLSRWKLLDRWRSNHTNEDDV